MQEALFSQQPQPGERAVEISASGIAFTASKAAADAAWLGLHFVLPSCYHVLCCAQVCRSKGSPDSTKHHLAARFKTLDIAASKRLSRFVIDNKC
jgi:hypothetical protein